MTDPLTRRLRLAVASSAELGEEEAATGGRRVFLARSRSDTPDAGPSRRVVLHPLPPEGPSRDALVRRTDQLLVLTHPAIAAPIATGELDGRAWIIDPIPPGIPLLQRLADRGTLPLREAITILREVARALAALHRRELTHGRIWAGTVMLDRRGTVLTSFGLVADASPKDDLHALGALAWEMLVGLPPRTSGGFPLRTYRPSAPAALERLVGGLLSPDGDPRPGRAEDVLDILDHFPPLTPAPIADFLDGVAAGGGRRSRRRRGIMVTLGSLLGRLRGA
jgi:serine/threonine-protein kinase